MDDVVVEGYLWLGEFVFEGYDCCFGCVVLFDGFDVFVVVGCVWVEVFVVGVVGFLCGVDGGLVYVCVVVLVGFVCECEG